MKRVLSFVSVVGVVLVLNWFSGESSDGPIEDVDLPDGPFEEYHDNGQLFMKGTVKDGELIVKGSYKDGEPCGEWIMLGETVTQELPY
jgi:hypothetical protein